MRMRRRGVGIVGVAAVAHVAGRRGEQRQAAADQNAMQQQEMAAAQQAPPPAPEVDPTTAELQKLAGLHAQGILTDEEFASAKAKALGI